MVKILLIEGHPFIKMLRAQLETESDFRVIGEVSDGLSAIEQARRMQPDTIILDYDTPGMNGFEVIREIHLHLPAIPIILLSLSDDESLRSQAAQAGAAAFIAKEVNTGVLVTAVRNSMGGRDVNHPAAGNPGSR